MKGDAAGCEAVDVRGSDVVCAEAFEFGAEIVDANEKDVGLLGCEGDLCGGGAEKEAKGDERTSHVLLLLVSVLLDC